VHGGQRWEAAILGQWGHGAALRWKAALVAHA
jgi:hypothetical protein